MIRRVSADGDYAMKTDITSTIAAPPQPEIFTGDDWVDPLETEIRGRIQGFIEAVAEQELQRLLSRGHYVRRPAGAAGGRRRWSSPRPPQPNFKGNVR